MHIHCGTRNSTFVILNTVGAKSSRCSAPTEPSWIHCSSDVSAYLP